MSGNGFVGHSEIKFVLDALKANATDAEIDEMIRIVDMNKDNQVEYKEFWRMAAGETLEPVSKLVWQEKKKESWMDMGNEKSKNNL